MTRSSALAGCTLAATLAAMMFVVRVAPCDAHAVGVSRGEYRVEGATVRTELVFARAELLTALPDLDRDRDRALSTRELEDGRGIIADWMHHGVVIRVATEACADRSITATLSEEDGVRLAAVYDCPRPATALSVRLELLGDLSLGHRHLVTVSSSSAIVRDVLYAAQPELAIAPASRGELGTVGASLFRLGVEHILTGYDHLLFLLALVLVGGSLRSVLGIVTAFTLAHSVTLAVAAFDVWTPRSTLVEPAIALSIAYVGVENCLRPDLRRRWRLTFLFGLVHGFGFAGALREVATSASQLPLALASFNVGVEAGQLAVLAAVLPATWWLRRRPWFANGGLQAASIAIAVVGVSWFTVRIVAG
jgi:hydrogenase/urease accessory protein HupE